MPPRKPLKDDFLKVIPENREFSIILFGSHVVTAKLNWFYYSCNGYETKVTKEILSNKNCHLRGARVTVPLLFALEPTADIFSCNSRAGSVVCAGGFNPRIRYFNPRVNWKMVIEFDRQRIAIDDWDFDTEKLRNVLEDLHVLLLRIANHEKEMLREQSAKRFE
jgi:hypothetical protein